MPTDQSTCTVLYYRIHSRDLLRFPCPVCAVLVLSQTGHPSSAGKQMSLNDRKLYVAARDGNFDAVLDLLSSGANIRYRDIWDGMTPLMVASYRGHAQCVALLLGRGANPMWRMRDGSTALHFAAGFGHTEVCKVLCAYAPSHAQNLRGETPIDWALGNGRTRLADMLANQTDIVFKGKVLRAKLIIALKRAIRTLRERAEAAKAAEEEARLAEEEKEAAKADKQGKRRGSRLSRESRKSTEGTGGGSLTAALRGEESKPALGRRSARASRESRASYESGVPWYERKDVVDMVQS